MDTSHSHPEADDDMLPEYDFSGSVRGKYYERFSAQSPLSFDDLKIPREWLEEFAAAARRPLKERFKYSFIKTYKPVMDDAPSRAWDTTAEYRKWCEENLPAWLGYGQSI